jgi:hypothetical protein
MIFTHQLRRQKKKTQCRRITPQKLKVAQGLDIRSGEPNRAAGDCTDDLTEPSRAIYSPWPNCHHHSKQIIIFLSSLKSVFSKIFLSEGPGDAKSRCDLMSGRMRRGLCPLY